MLDDLRQPQQVERVIMKKRFLQYHKHMQCVKLIAHFAIISDKTAATIKAVDNIHKEERLFAYASTTHASYSRTPVKRALEKVKLEQVAYPVPGGGEVLDVGESCYISRNKEAGANRPKGKH